MRKFLCYDTNDAASGKISVSTNGVLSPNATVPSTNGAANQYLVTDSNGNAKWEDRLAYEHTEWKDFTLNYDDAIGIEITGFTMPPVGDTVTVKVDGVESVETVTLLKVDDYRYIRYIGKSPLTIVQGAPGWSIAWYSEKEQVLGIARVPTTVSLLVTKQHKIDQKYIPNQRFDVIISYDDDDNLVSDKTPEEILEAYNNGQIVSGVYEDEKLLSLIHVNKTEASFFQGLGYAENFLMYRIGTDKMVNAAEAWMLPDVNVSSDGKFLVVSGGQWVASNTLILPSSTSGSSKKFKITVDDSGAITATEV